jgi:RNA recognition motif-containing protein
MFKEGRELEINSIGNKDQSQQLEQLPGSSAENPNQIFVGDVSKFCNAAKLKSLFLQFGRVIDVNIKRNSKTGKPKSYGFVTFEDSKCAANAIEQLDGFEYFGRKLR